MKMVIMLMAVCVLLGGCTGPGTGASRSEPIPKGDHSHTAGVDNVVAHEPVGYCGNTVTKVVFPYSGQEAWSVSFWADKSVALTDFLRWLDYSDPICRCLPEYRVITEFGGDYGISLSQGYARCGERQVSLTQQQTDELRQILDWAKAEAGKGADVCSYPKAEYFLGALS